MQHQISVTGMVLSVTPIGEYDKRVVLLTKERGRLSAFAKGARKQNSPLGGAVSPFCFGEFLLYEGRSSYTITQVNITNYFQDVRSNMEAAYYGFYFMEFAEYYTREGNDETRMLKLLYQTLRALSNEHIKNPLVRAIFELKSIYINGEGPEVFHCLKCGKEEHITLFSAKEGGVICDCCKKGIYDGIAMDTSTLYAMQYIASVPVEKLYTFTVTDEVLYKLKKIVSRYISIYVDKHFKSLEILEICLRT